MNYNHLIYIEINYKLSVFQSITPYIFLHTIWNKMEVTSPIEAPKPPNWTSKTWERLKNFK